LFPNPERGFYHYIESRASALTPYELETLQRYRTDEQITLLYCIYYLDSFVERSIAGDFLAHIGANLEKVRAAGLKCLLRFAYTDDDPTGRDEEPPFGDATKARILEHIAQLRPLLQEHADVIALVQAGFIGVWGEWYYTDHFVDDPSNPGAISPAQYANRLDVLTALRDALPPTHYVAVRYPHVKQGMLGDEMPLSAGTAYGNTTAARTGYHNDCFLADDSDYGTYRVEKLEADKAYLAAETAFVPMGGETCNPNPPRSLCLTALAEMERFHWSYVNRDFHADVYEAWESGGCVDDMQRRLGYRLVMQQGEYGGAVRPGDGLLVHFELQNVGYAAPYSMRRVRLLLRSMDDGTLYAAQLPEDPRRWLPGATFTVEYMVGVHRQIAAGDYELLLHLPDAAPELHTRPEYAIRFANEDMWEATTGYNRLLHTVHVAVDAPAAPFSGDLYFSSPGSDFVRFIFLPLITQ
jgi:hypothetical protein